MATKTFKIGLSNTDKQNMAQDVYERLIAMCFDEYDSTKTYNEGDFVVYENPSDTFKLYKCNSDEVTGAWDSTKWDLATFQDLVDDIESAVAFVNDKANVDGNYPTMTVGVADQLSPYDDESGNDQSEPFSFQATGTANGTQPDFATGSIALMKEKQGNSVVVNNQVQNGTFTSTTGWTAGGTITASNNILHYVPTDLSNSSAIIGNTMNSVIGHKYLISCDLKFNNTLPNTSVFIGFGGYEGINYSINALNTWTRAYGIMQRTNNSGTNYASIYTRCKNWTSGDSVDLRNFYCIDLTQWFGSNDAIPQDLLDHPENFFHYYQGSLAYNTGELVNANSRYIKCIGRNQWDEQWELGSINVSTGANDVNNNCIRSKNYIRCLPNKPYFLHSSKTDGGSNNKYYIGVIFYDVNKNYIGYIYTNNLSFTTPINCCFIRFTTNTATVIYGSTYLNDITISIYYEDESGYSDYYPYQVLTNNDTGTETLRSASSVKDYKTPDGVVHRLIGSYTFTGSESWTKAGSPTTSGMYRYFTEITSMKSGSYINGVCSKFATINANYNSATENGVVFGISNQYMQYLSTSELTTTQVATLFENVKINYELATPTTEQGTLFSENINIDDFGSMEFSGTSGVPQGNLIFYPVDYKAFIDTLYDYTEGTPSELVKQSDLSTSESARDTVDTQLQNAIGGTLRQCLCVKETLDFNNTAFVDLGSLSWVYDTTYSRFFSTSVQDYKQPANNDTVGHILCSKYKSRIASGSDTSKGIAVASAYTGGILVYDTNYTDATVFKAAMKGVLLAYEKA